MKLNKKISDIILLFVGAVLIAFSGLNWHNGIAAWIGPVFLLMYSRNTQWKFMWLFFIIISFAGGISMTENNFIHIPVVIIFNGIGFGILTIIPYIVDKLLNKKGNKFHYSLIFPTAIALVEFLASFAMGTWGSIAHTQYEFKPLMQLSSVTGIYIIWFIVAWFASVVNWIIENKSNGQAVLKGLLTFGGVLSMVLLYGFSSFKSVAPSVKTVKVAAVISENNIHEIAVRESEKFKEISSDSTMKIPARIFSDSLLVEKLINRTKKSAKLGAQIIVWNEVALILNQKQKQSLISEIQSVCKKEKVYILLAFLEESIERDKKPFNNICILISPKGELAWEYKKSYLEPHTEAKLVNNGNFDLPVLQTQYGKIGTAICADLDIQNYIKQAGEKAVDILLVPAFDWAGITPLHSQMASVEAIQFGFNLVRANGKGISAVYNYKGKELASLNNLNTNEKILMAELPLQSITTIYSKTGNVFIYLCMAFMAFVLIMHFLKPKKN